MSYGISDTKIISDHIENTQLKAEIKFNNHHTNFSNGTDTGKHKHNKKKPPEFLPETPTRNKRDQRSLLWQNQVPLVLREPNVYTGYRYPNQSWMYYLKSVFQTHNESINVWTHLGGLILALRMLFWVYLPGTGKPVLENPHVWPFITGYATCCGLFICSIIAHLLGSRSAFHHYVFFMVDYAGIGLYGMGTSIQHLYYCGEDNFFDNNHMYLPIMVFLSILSCYVSCYYKVKYNRPYPKIRKIAQVGSVFFMYMWIIYPLMPRFHHCLLQWWSNSVGDLSSCDPALSLHLKQIFWFASAGLFYGSNLPERLWPGKFDLYGHGHQVFHVCILMTTFYANEAAFLDMKAKAESPSALRLPRSWLSCAWPIALVFLAEFAIIFHLSGMARKKIEARHGEEEKKDRL